MTDKQMRYIKPKVECMWCGKIVTVNGLTTHVNLKHPDHVEEFKNNRDKLIQEFRCDADGVRINETQIIQKTSPKNPITPPDPITHVDQEVVSETLPDPHEPIVEHVPTPPTPPPEPKVPPTDKFQEKEDEQKPKEGYFYDPYGFGR